MPNIPLGRGLTANLGAGQVPTTLILNGVAASYNIQIGAGPVMHGVAQAGQPVIYPVNGLAVTITNTTPAPGAVNLWISWEAMMMDAGPAGSVKDGASAAQHGAGDAAAPQADLPSLQAAVQAAILQAAAPAATSLGMSNVQPVDSGLLGNFPWYWQSGTNFNAKTYTWLDNVFAYSTTNEDIETNGTELMTAYFNVLMATSYVLDAADASALNAAVLANQTVANTVVTDWTTSFGAIPATDGTLVTQLNYVTSQVLLWGAPGLTLGTLRSSLNPMSLLPNIPLGGDQVVSDLMTYLANTSSVANIQAAVVSYNNQLAQTRVNVSPAPTTPSAGWMQTINDSGTTAIVPAMSFDQSTATLQNNLLPASGTGLSFTSTLTASKGANNVTSIEASGGIGGSGDILGILSFSASAGSSFSLWDVDATVTTVEVGLTFNGVTLATPQYSAYSVSTGTGWWNPAPIQQAVGYSSTSSGYEFKPTPAYDFGVNGDFGLLSNLMISQVPVLTLTYDTSNYAAFEKVFTAEAQFSVHLFGIPLAGGSVAYYSSASSFNSSSNQVTVTLTPVAVSTPVAATDQLAYVIGAEVLWPGA